MMCTSVPGCLVGGEVIQMEVFRLGDIEIVPQVFLLRNGIIYCIRRIHLGILPGFLRYLMKRKFRSKWGYMLFPNEKRINLKVLVSPNSDLWKRYRMSPGHEFIGKKEMPSWDSVFELWSSEGSCSERDSIFFISVLKKAALAICW